MYTALGGGGGLFQKFDWMPEEFELCKCHPLSETFIEEEKKKQQRIELRQKQYNVHKSVEFNSAMIKPAQKFEYPFLGNEEVYTYSFLLADDPYDSTKDERLRAKWI